jgi:hypothetical protein
VYCTEHQGDAAMEETVWDDQHAGQPLEAAADTAVDVGEDVDCMAEYAVSVEVDAVDGAAATGAVANDAAGDGAVVAASLVYASV